MRAAFGFDGRFGESSWIWDAYYHFGFGETDREQLPDGPSKPFTPKVLIVTCVTFVVRWRRTHPPTRSTGCHRYLKLHGRIVDFMRQIRGWPESQSRGAIT